MRLVIYGRVFTFAQQLAYTEMKITTSASLTLDLTNFANWPRLRNLFTMISFTFW